MISYAQNHEDVLLARALKNQSTGFYIDVGAADPRIDSVTKYFYDLGWNGINIEPNSDFFKDLNTDRERDINLRIALSDFEGEGVLYSLPPYNGLSTLIPYQVEKYSLEGGKKKEETISVSTLEKVCTKYVHQPIDFLKIDVEGSEKGVILGGNWERYRPRIVVIEATEPRSTVPSYQQWEPLLLSYGYLFAAFDGLNRYYVSQEESKLAEVFMIPANVLDDFVTRESVDLKKEKHAIWCEMVEFKERTNECIQGMHQSYAVLEQRFKEISQENSNFQEQLIVQVEQLNKKNILIGEITQQLNSRRHVFIENIYQFFSTRLPVVKKAVKFILDKVWN